MFNVFTCDVFTLRNNLACCTFIMVCVGVCMRVSQVFNIWYWQGEGIGAFCVGVLYKVTALC